MEGVYSLSQLMGLVNHSFFDPAHRTSRYKYDAPLTHTHLCLKTQLFSFFFRPLMQTLSLITTIVSNVEVFAEGVSCMFGTAQQRNLLVSRSPSFQPNFHIQLTTYYRDC